MVEWQTSFFHFSAMCRHLNLSEPFVVLKCGAAKGGSFQKKSTVIWDTTGGGSNRQLAAKMVYNNFLDSNARLGLHDSIINTIDASGMDGVSLFETLEQLLVGLHEEGIGTPEIDEAWWNLHRKKKIDSSLTSESVQKALLTMKLFTRSAFLMVSESDSVISFEADHLLHTRRLLVFLFGAFDAVVQHHHITEQEKFDTLETYLTQTFPLTSPIGIQEAVSFLIEASSDLAWTPIMEHGGQTLVAWTRGDKTAPSNLTIVLLEGYG